MTITITRGASINDGTPGVMSRDFSCDTLERTSALIPPGRYSVTLTTSERCRKGELWSPRADHVLPLIQNVPGRSGIRIHAGNRAADVVGCIAIGTASPMLPGEIHDSRAMLTAFMNRLAKASVCWLEIA